MPGTIAERLTMLRAGMLRTPELRHVRSSDILSSAASWYGWQRRRFARSIRVVHDEDALDWIEIAGYRLAWPTNAPLDRLVMALVELSSPSNPHYYFRSPTTVRSGDMIVDVGACEGLFGLDAIVRRLAERVWCFEPAPLMARALRETACRNGLSERMTIVEAAAGAGNGVCRFVEDAGNPLASRIENAPNGTGQEVSAITLDDWADSNDVTRVDYLKIDAEGSDVDVLEGARAVLRRFRPRIAATTYHEADHCERMIGILRELDVGYRTVVRGVVTFDAVARPVMLHASVS